VAFIDLEEKMNIFQTLSFIIYLNSVLSVYFIGKIKEKEQYERNELIVDIVTMETISLVMNRHKIYAVIPFLNTIYLTIYLIFDIFKKKVD
jgi:hypothetical protein